MFMGLQFKILKFMPDLLCWEKELIGRMALATYSCSQILGHISRNLQNKVSKSCFVKLMKMLFVILTQPFNMEFMLLVKSFALILRRKYICRLMGNRLVKPAPALEE